MVRQTSAAVYRQIEAKGLLSRMRWETYKLLFKHGPCTASELFATAKREHRNTSLRDCYQKRLGELRDQGAVSELGTRICSISGRDVTVWDVTAKLPNPLPRPKEKIRCERCDGKGYLEEHEIKKKRPKRSAKPKNFESDDERQMTFF